MLRIRNFIVKLFLTPLATMIELPLIESEWSIRGSVRVRNQKEHLFDLDQSGVAWREIYDSSVLDTSNPQLPDRPKPNSGKIL